MHPPKDAFPESGHAVAMVSLFFVHFDFILVIWILKQEVVPFHVGAVLSVGLIPETGGL